MLPSIKTALIAGAAIAALSQVAFAADVKIAVIGGITGPIESLAPPIIAGGKYVFQEVNEQGGFWKDGTKVQTVVLDDTCSDATKAADAGDR